MNSIDDLRRTLDTHAQDAHHGVDAGALSDRIRTARRRRNATRGGVAALTVAAVAAAALTIAPWNRLPDGTAVELLGANAPATVEAGGLTYRYSEHVVADGKEATIDIGTKERPRLLMWVTEGSGQSVTIAASEGDAPEVPSGPAWTSTSPDFDDWFAPDSWATGKFTVTGAQNSGRVGVVLYELDASAPSASLFLNEKNLNQAPAATVPGTDLVDWAVGAPGQTELTVDWPGGLSADQAGDVSLACRNLPDDHWIEWGTDPDWRGISTTGCAETDGPALGHTSLFSGDNSDEATRLRVRILDKDRKPVPDGTFPDFRVAVATWTVDVDASTAQEKEDGDLGTPRTIARHGHLWALEQTLESTKGVSFKSSDSSRPQLARVQTSVPDVDRGDPFSTELIADGTVLMEDTTSLDDGVTITQDVVLPIGATDMEAVARATSEGKASSAPRARVKVLLYSLAD